MTILHLTWLPHISGYEGIVAKLHDLANSARLASVELHVAVLSHDKGPSIIHPIPGHGAFNAICCRLGKSSYIERFLDRLQPEAVVLRYPGALDWHFPAMLSTWGHRLVTEHHTDEIAELGELRCGWIRQRLESTLGRYALGRVAGGITVTGEIASLIRRRGLTAPLKVVANGVSVDRFTPWSPPQDRADPLRLIMIAGVFWPWHGLDRILTGMLLHPRAPLELHLVGAITDPNLCSLMKQVRILHRDLVVHHGPMDQAQITALMTRMHCAASSLALHRNGLSEACPIKSREYAARGIPFLQSYLDPDMPPGTPGVAQVPGGDDPLPPEQLVLIARQLIGSNPSQALRHHARMHLDYRVKAGEIAAFARSTVHASGPPSPMTQPIGKDTP